MNQHDTLFTLQKLVAEFSKVDRNHNRHKSDDQENDVEHSFAVALLCWYLIQKHQFDLSLEKILRYSLVHDFAEIYAGDVNTYANSAERTLKVQRERDALKRLRKEIPDFTQLTDDIENYEKRTDEESKFVWTVDKMQALILGDLDNWRPYKRVNVTYAMLLEKSAEILSKSSKYAESIYEDLVEYCKLTYYDRP